LVVAETFEGASEAAARIAVRYDAEPPSVTIGSEGTTVTPVAEVDTTHKVLGDGRRITAGNAAMLLEDAFRHLGQSVIEEYAESIPRSMSPGDMDKLYQGHGSVRLGSRGWANSAMSASTPPSPTPSFTRRANASEPCRSGWRRCWRDTAIVSFARKSIGRTQ
jgi:hypothetical protein